MPSRGLRPDRTVESTAGDRAEIGNGRWDDGVRQARQIDLMKPAPQPFVPMARGTADRSHSRFQLGKQAGRAKRIATRFAAFAGIDHLRPRWGGSQTPVRDRTGRVANTASSSESAVLEQFHVNSRQQVGGNGSCAHKFNGRLCMAPAKAGSGELGAPAPPAVPVWRAILAGVVDAVSLHNVAAFVLMSATVRRNMLRCALLNIVIFSGSILLTSQIVMPVIRAIIGDSSTATFLGLLLDRLYRIFWIWPVYCLSFLFNTVWYQSIADSAFIISARKPSRRRASVSDWVAAMAEEVYRFALLGCFVAQVAMLSLLPLIGSLAWNVLMTWLYSFYMWEYKWALQGWTMDQRVAFFQRRWAYFFGFGAPATLLSVVWPTFISYGVFAFLFPCFIILAIASRPQPHVGFAAETGIPIFASSMVLSGKLASLCRPAPRSRTRDHED